MNKTFLLLDSSMTLHGLRFRVEAGKMERFISNAIMLYMHVRGVVIGEWENVRMENGGWYADSKFDTEDPDAAKIAGKVERGFLKAASAGIIPLKVEEIEGELWVTDWEMIESSIVDSGSNAAALALYTPAGDLVEDTKQAIINLTTPIMSEQKKIIPGAGSEGAVIPVVPKVIALAAGLAEDATENLVADKIKELVEENKALKLSSKTAQETAIKTLLDKHQAEGKFTAALRPHYEQMASVNLASVEAMLNGMSAPVNLSSFAQQGAQGNAAATLSDKDLFDKMDKEGTLISLKSENPERFKEIFKARWGRDPK